MEFKNYVSNLYSYLKALGNDEIAMKQSQYMRNKFPFFGLMKENQTKYWKEFQEIHGQVKPENAIEFCRECIQYPEREMWYIGQQFLIKNKKKMMAEDLDFVKELIVKSDWWDVVDIVASNVVGMICTNFPEKKSEVHSWIHHDNFWLRRVAIIYQLGYKKQTDEDVLYSHILKTCHETEFFIRKAIGWSLREYSKHNKDSVRFFIESNSDSLSGLSIREGSKYL